MKMNPHKITEAMAVNRMSQNDLAAGCQIAPSTLSYILRRIRDGHEVTPKVAGRLAFALGVHVTDIMAGKSDREAGR